MVAGRGDWRFAAAKAGNDDPDHAVLDRDRITVDMFTQATH
jgi:hypothetical protein